MSMKYIKKFNEEQDVKSIEYWCKYFKLINYTINDDETVDVENKVSIFKSGFEKFPIQFGIVCGFFDCRYNNLITLEGSPRIVKNDFYCTGNNLITLEGSPRKVLYNFHCNSNKLVTLVGGPEKVGEFYYCEDNNLISFDGMPIEIYENARFHCKFNPIWYLYKIFNNHKDYISSLDYNYLVGYSIIKLRFVEALEEAGIKKVPESIPGYKYI